MTPGVQAQVPRFSVIVPAYEASATLAETLDAMLAQTYVDWECVVVDDGSTDDTLEITSAYAERDPRIRAVHQANQGTAGAYNTGVSTAIGDFIVICSADDILLPEHLERMSAFIEAEAGYDIYSTNGYFWVPGESRALFYGSIDTEQPQFALGDAIRSMELAEVIQQCFYSVGAVYRRDVFATTGGYRRGVYGEDYDFWLRAMAHGARHRYLPEPLSLHRISEEQKSARLETVFRSDIRLLSDLRREFRLSPADSRAVAETIRERQIRIARLVFRRLAIRLIGRQRARRVHRVVQAAVARLLQG